VLFLGGAAFLVHIHKISRARTGEHEPVIKPQTALARSISQREAGRAGLTLHEALFYKKIRKGAVRCTLCPHGCTLLSGERGRCKVRANFGGVLYSLVYSRVVACHIDPIEKNPLFHFTPGERTLSIATAVCNLGCKFCQNWSTSQSYPEDTRFAVLNPEDNVSLARQHGCSAMQKKISGISPHESVIPSEMMRLFTFRATFPHTKCSLLPHRSKHCCVHGILHTKRG